MSSYRLSAGGRIDRSKLLNFTFERKSYSGFAGDTLGSALLANGVSVVGRSFKYHRPRGLIAAGLDEPNGIVQVGEGAHSTPNLKAPGVELYDGLKARPVNAWPSLAFDLLSVNSIFKQFIPAAFYYKTFMWPDWHLFEPVIRKAAGLGVAPTEPDADIYDKRYAECDVLVVGGGPAGLAAARTAARSGARALLVETDFEWGGSLLAGDAAIEGKPSEAWIADACEELRAAKNVTLLNRTVAFGIYDHSLVGLCQRLTDHLPTSQRSGPRQRFWKVRSAQTILATGAFERPLVFPNNDRPGVMLANAGAAYAKRFAASPGRRVVIATNNDSGYQSALTLQASGVDVVAIADARTKPEGDLVSRALNTGVAHLPGTTVTDVFGGKAVREVELHAIDNDNRAIPDRKYRIDCDALLTSGGWSPVVHLYSQAGGRLQFDDQLKGFIPKSCAQSVVCVGGAAGEMSLIRSINAGATAGADASEGAGYKTVATDEIHGGDAEFGETRALWQVDVSTLNKRGKKAWLDFQNDVTASDVKLAIRESFKSVEHVKRYTTLGMASDQGKTSNVNGIGVMEAALGKPMAQVGTTKFRPPFDPTTIGAFAGRRVGENVMPLRSLAAEAHHKALGAKFEDYGGWRRAACYPKAGEDEEAAIMREALAVRQKLGLFDASPLGKIEVYGPNAREFLTRVYINNMKTVKPGRCRYGLMLNENGIVFDDGVLACIGENHYLVGTTSGHAGMIAGILQEWLQCEWTDLDVVTDDVTTAWAVMNINGARARDLLQKFDSDIDFSKDAFPHMHFRAGILGGVRARVQRVSFSGELSYEVSVPWSYGASFWKQLMEAGRDFEITPFGVETLMTLRIEKGFLHVGSDTDGMTMPHDLGFGPMIAKKKGDFIGRRSTMRPDAVREDRRQLVGLECLDGDAPFAIGAHVLDKGVEAPAKTKGWVTSSVYSPNLNRPVALGLVERGVSRMGEEVQIWDLGATRRARIVSPGGFDSQGERLNG